MKTFLVLVLAALAGAGCNSKQAALEQRLQKLESRVQRLANLAVENSETNALHIELLAAQITKWGATNVALSRELGKSLDADMVLEVESAVREAVDARFSEMKRPAPAAGRVAAVAPLPEGLKEGIPAAVYNQIRAEAARRYPTDFRMQASVIEMQVEAYKKFHPAK